MTKLSRKELNRMIRKAVNESVKGQRTANKSTGKLTVGELKAMVREAIGEQLDAGQGIQRASVGSAQQLSRSGGGDVSGAVETEESKANRFKQLSAEMGKLAGLLATNPFHTNGVAINKRIGELQNELAGVLDQMGRKAG